MNANHIDALVGNACSEAAYTVARGLVLGIDNCAATGRPLNQLQQIELIQGALMEHDGHRAKLESGFKVMTALDNLAARDDAS